jgi:predicted adenine nucleotide alpha hydrolase (AANH) superfamily ATPase
MFSGTNNQPTSKKSSPAAGDGRASVSKRGKDDGGEREAILVHACCASCSSYVLAHLGEHYAVTAYYYNPNIHPREEYLLRLEEMRRVCNGLGVPLLEGLYDADEWWSRIEPYRELPERSERCWHCYRLRLDETARKAVELGIGLFTTTLSVSPHKVHRCIVSEGEAAAERHGLRFLAEDFKKRDGFKISVERSRELGLTRQGYCGCLLSLEEAKRRKP